MLFLAGMVVTTSSKYTLASGSHDFKSCALPLVFTGLEADATSSVRDGRFGMAEMKLEARTMQVQLRRPMKGGSL
jgi:hypothetical protein